MRLLRRWRAALVVAAIPLLLAGCATEDSTTPTSSASPTSVDRDAALAAKVPADIRARGKLIVGTAIPYRPSVFLGADGKPTGFEVEVVDAVGKILGLTPGYVNTDFASIIPGVAAGTYDLGMRSIFDTKDREKQVDMVTYFSGGTQWVRRADDGVDPNDACGKKVGVENGTVQATTEIPAKSQSCTVTGDPPITATGFGTLDDALAALKDRRVQAVSSDSLAVSYAVAQSANALATAGAPFDTEPYALAIRKGSELAKPLQAALQKLIDTGTMRAIAHKWGLDSGLVTASQINGATSS
ncbi:transporter substrate-binding domain-containing protein [Gordonia sp. DT30]|uniref:ABC transporter substrate-binding protein n=1 Tax=unclassified Gordonia (in: high G+C Gram-positive bacteria) TaxID=2657482 RepID=UPI003CF69130